MTFYLDDNCWKFDAHKFQCMNCLYCCFWCELLHLMCVVAATARANNCWDAKQTLKTTCVWKCLSMSVIQWFFSIKTPLFKGFPSGQAAHILAGDTNTLLYPSQQRPPLYKDDFAPALVVVINEETHRPWQCITDWNFCLIHSTGMYFHRSWLPRFLQLSQSYELVLGLCPKLRVKSLLLSSI